MASVPGRWLPGIEDFGWADRFGWLPDEVDRQNPRRMRDLIVVTLAATEGRELRRKQEQRQRG